MAVSVFVCVSVLTWVRFAFVCCVLRLCEKTNVFVDSTTSTCISTAAIIFPCDCVRYCAAMEIFVAPLVIGGILNFLGCIFLCVACSMPSTVTHQAYVTPGQAHVYHNTNAIGQPQYANTAQPYVAQPAQVYRPL